MVQVNLTIRDDVVCLYYCIHFFSSTQTKKKEKKIKKKRKRKEKKKGAHKWYGE